jgi:ubiquinol-cytochrome c reductase cytochrome b subunit
MGVYFILFFYLVFYNFDFAMAPLNFDPADGLKTPAHIYTEWYFLWSYEILRPFGKDVGLIAFAISQIAFVFLPFIDRSPNVAPAHKRGLFQIWFWVLLIDMIVLTAMGKLPPTDPVFAIIGLVSACLFLAMGPLLLIITMFEKKIEKGA